MKNLYIYGVSFLDVIKLIDAINLNNPTWKIVGFLDDAEQYKGKVIEGYPVLGGQKILPQLVNDQNAYIFNNVTNWDRCMNVTKIIDSHACKTACLIHPLVDMNYVEIGRNCIIPEGCVVGGRVKFGNFVKMRLKALVSHDAIVEDYAVIGPGAVVGSNAIIKTGALVGAGATVMSGRVVGRYSIVGAGAVVTTEVPANTKVAGVPAKAI